MPLLPHKGRLIQMPQKTTGMTMTLPINVITQRTEKQHKPDELLIMAKEQGGCSSTVQGEGGAGSDGFGNTPCAFYISFQKFTLPIPILSLGSRKDLQSLHALFAGFSKEQGQLGKQARNACLGPG